MMFYVLDVSYEVEVGRPSILIWAIDEKDRRILLKDFRFRPYFYVIPHEGANLEKLCKEIKLLSKPKSPIIKLEVLKKRYIGKEIEVIKVTTVLPESVREYREEIKRLKEVMDVVEADIRFAMRYIIDKGLRPNSWHRADVRSLGRQPQYRVEEVYELLSDPQPAERSTKPKLREMAFDIEVYNREGTPRP